MKATQIVKLQNNQIVNVFFFVKQPTGRTHGVCGVYVAQKERYSYRNLISHIESNHVSFKKVASCYLSDGLAPAPDMFVHKHAFDTLGWMRLVALKNMSLPCVDDPAVRESITFRSMLSETLFDRMIALRYAQ